MCTINKKWIKTKMKTPIRLNSKGNEVIVWCSLNILLCVFFNKHHRCMCCHHQCLLHHIYASWVSNDDVHWGLKAISDDKDIHSSSGVMKEKVRNLYLNMFSILQSNNCDDIPKCIVDYCTFTPAKALKQMGTEIVNDMTTLTSWKMENCRIW